VTQVVHGKRVTTVKAAQEKHELSSRIYALDLSTDVWVAAAEGGIFTSRDQGATWQGGPAAGAGDYRSVAAHDSTMVAAQTSGLVLSSDAGQTWTPVNIPIAITRIYRVVFSADGTLWLGARQGVYFSRDRGRNWMWLQRLPLVDVSGLSYDARQDRILASSRGSDFVYSIDTKSLNWTWQKTGFPLNQVRSAAGHLIAASLRDGVLTESGTEQAQGGGAGVSTRTAQ
jgi:ligand-binding sensor domain-containing protein